MEFDPQLMVPDASLSISEGAIQVMGWQSCTDPKSYTYATLRALHEGYGLPLDTPIDDLSEDMKNCFLRWRWQSAQGQIQGSERRRRL